MLSALLALALGGADPVWLPGAPEKDRFKAHFTQGEKLYSQGEYGAAIWNFRQADRLLATPEVIYDLAKCHEKLGDLPFATYYYRLYLKRSPAATDALEVAERVGAALSQAEANGRGFLEVEVPGGDSLLVAGQRFPEGPLALFLAPGDYDVTGTFPEGVKRVVAQLRTGKTSTVNFEPLAPPLLSAEPGDPIEVTTVKTGGKTSGLRVTSYLTFGVGLAALGVGTALGVIAAGESSRLQNDKSLNFTQAQALASSANTKGLAANVLWGVGGAAAASGVVMFIVSMPEPGMQRSGGR